MTTPFEVIVVTLIDFAAPGGFRRLEDPGSLNRRRSDVEHYWLLFGLETANGSIWLEVFRPWTLMFETDIRISFERPEW